MLVPRHYVRLEASNKSPRLLKGIYPVELSVCFLPAGVSLKKQGTQAVSTL